MKEETKKNGQINYSPVNVLSIAKLDLKIDLLALLLIWRCTMFPSAGLMRISEINIGNSLQEVDGYR